MGVRNCADLGRNLQKIVKRLLADQTLCKLLYYAGKDPLGQPDIEDTSILLEKQIRMIPKYNPSELDYSVVNLVVQSGTRDKQNEEFREIAIRCYVFVPISNWIIKSDNLRPFLILGELQEALSNKKINGLGTIQTGDFALKMVTEQMTCYYIDFSITNFN